jgi:hypothetical protein
LEEKNSSLETIGWAMEEEVEGGKEGGLLATSVDEVWPPVRHTAAAKPHKCPWWGLLQQNKISQDMHIISLFSFHKYSYNHIYSFQHFHGTIICCFQRIPEFPAK